MYKISIILPCYNVAPYVKRCIDSLKRQKFTDFEAVFINDGSTDNTLSVIQNAIQGLTNFSVYSYNNQGLSQARNEGIKLAKGNYLFFCDPDDYVEDNALYVAYQATNNEEYDAVQFFFKTINENGVERNGNNGTKEIGLYSNETIRKKFLPIFLGYSNLDIQNFGKEIFDSIKEFQSVWRFLYRKSILNINHISFPVGVSIIEDKIFNCTFFCFANTIYVIDDVLYNYCIRSSGLLKNSKQNFDQFYRAKIDGITERVKLRNLYISKSLIDIRPFYAGSIFLSGIEILLRMSSFPIKQKYYFIRKYYSYKEVGECISTIPIKGSLKIKTLLILCKTKSFRTLSVLFKLVKVH